MKRRDFLVGAGALALAPHLSIDDALALNAPPIGSCVLNPPTIDKPVKPERAASLKRILAEAKTGARPSFGMTRIDGYTLLPQRFVVTRRGLEQEDDVILWGRNEPWGKELIFDDLVVALRSVWGRYGAGPPTISLQYVPGTLIGDTEEQAQEEVRFNKILLSTTTSADYKRACIREVHLYPRVLFLPKDSHVAKDLLDADYLMKRVTSGDHLLKVNDPRLNPQKILHEMKVRIADGVAGPAERLIFEKTQQTGLGTRWFVPGQMSYVRDENSIFIDCVQILLRARFRKVGALGKIEGDPVSGDLVCTWTNRMDEVARTEPLIGRLRDIFRMFALARILTKTGELRWMMDRGVINDYPIPTVSVPYSYPSTVVDVLAWSSKRKRMMSSQICGGVLVRNQHTAPSSDAGADVRSDVNLAGKKALESMRSCTGSCTNVE
jgi:hypothetical protein